MPRAARKKSETKIYHVVLRGINRQTIFHDDEDYKRYLACLSEYQQISRPVFFAYCLMSNHIHLLLQETAEPLNVYFKRVGASFVYWYNQKYSRCGHLFQDRFKSEPVEDDEYFQTVFRYILQNPVKAGLCKKADSYKWSSHSPSIDQIGPHISYDKLQNILGCKTLDTSTNSAPLREPLEYNSGRVTNISVRKFLTSEGVLSSKDFALLDHGRKKELIVKMISRGHSIRQISATTGSTKWAVVRIIGQ